MFGIKPSIIALYAILAFTLFFRISEVHEREISWDAFGYYLYLPATIIHGDPLLQDIAWINQANDRYQLTATVYQLSSNDQGKPIYFFLMGMSLFYLPFFLLAHLIALLFGLQADGFSPIYHYALGIGSITYLFLAFIYLRRVLLKYGNDLVAGIVMLVLFFGTNAIEHLVTKNLETINVLFMLSTLVLWNTIQWEERRTPKHLYKIAFTIALMILVKPSEVLIIIIPIMWTVSSLSTLKERIIIFTKHRKDLMIGVSIALMIAVPQMFYWKLMTGSFIFDSYVNPGVGLDFFSPHIWEVLFSFRKGWFVYTPIAFLMLLSLAYAFLKHREIGLPILMYLFFEFWLVSSWSEWWYGAAFSCRPIIVMYPFLALCLTLLIMESKSGRIKRPLIIGIMMVFVGYNLLKWHQFREYIINPTRMTKQAFISTFWDLTWKKSNEKYLLVRRSYDGNPRMEFEHLYTEKAFPYDLAEPKFKSEYYELLNTPYLEITDSDHAWITFKIDSDQSALLVVEMNRVEGSYGYQVFEINKGKNEVKYLTPELRSESDIVHAYIWNRQKQTIHLNELSTLVFTRD